MFGDRIVHKQVIIPPKHNVGQQDIRRFFMCRSTSNSQVLFSTTGEDPPQPTDRPPPAPVSSDRRAGIHEVFQTGQGRPHCSTEQTDRISEQEKH